MDSGWAGYLAGFHDERAGITERVLTHAHDRGGDNPYDWLLAAVPSRGRVLDLACGSAPLRARQPGRRYLGIDVAPGELARARAGGAGPLVRASAAALPVADACIDVVVCSMGLMIATPLPAVLAEIGRVLVPGGRLVASLPARGPLRPRDLPVLAGLLAALGRGLGYPNDEPLARLPALLGDVGLRLVADDARRFAYRLRDVADADRLLASLYLPGLPAARYRRAARWLRAASRVRAVVAVPIRRVVAVRG